MQVYLEGENGIRLAIKECESIAESPAIGDIILKDANTKYVVLDSVLVYDLPNRFQEAAEEEQNQMVLDMIEGKYKVNHIILTVKELAKDTTIMSEEQPCLH